MRYRLIIVLIQDRNGEHTAFKPFVHHFFFRIITNSISRNCYTFIYKYGIIVI